MSNLRRHAFTDPDAILSRAERIHEELADQADALLGLHENLSAELERIDSAVADAARNPRAADLGELQRLVRRARAALESLRSGQTPLEVPLADTLQDAVDTLHANTPKGKSVVKQADRALVQAQEQAR